MLILHIRIIQYWCYLRCSLYQTCLVCDTALHLRPAPSLSCVWRFLGLFLFLVPQGMHTFPYLEGCHHYWSVVRSLFISMSFSLALCSRSARVHTTTPHLARMIASVPHLSLSVCHAVFYLSWGFSCVLPLFSCVLTTSDNPFPCAPVISCGSRYFCFFLHVSTHSRQPPGSLAAHSLRIWLHFSPPLCSLDSQTPWARSCTPDLLAPLVQPDQVSSGEHHISRLQGTYPLHCPPGAFVEDLGDDLGDDHPGDNGPRGNGPDVSRPVLHRSDLYEGSGGQGLA